MDYQFIRNDANQPEAIFSIDHLVLGLFLSTELASDATKINNILEAIRELENRNITSFEWLGSEYKLAIEHGDVCITALVLEQTCYDELPESTELYDKDQKHECGLLDFKEVLQDWQLFIK